MNMQDTRVSLLRRLKDSDAEVDFSRFRLRNVTKVTKHPFFRCKTTSNDVLNHPLKHIAVKTASKSTPEEAHAFKNVIQIDRGADL